MKAGDPVTDETEPFILTDFWVFNQNDLHFASKDKGILSICK